MKTTFRLYLAGFLCLALLPVTSLAHMNWFDDDDDDVRHSGPHAEFDFDDDDFDWFDDNDDFEEFDFATERDEIIAEMRDDVDVITDETDKKAYAELLTKLEATTDEDAFFTVLDDMDDLLEKYWDDEDWYEDCDDDDDCEFEEFDFATEREEIIAEIKEYLAELGDIPEAAEASALLTTLEGTTDEDAFFETLEKLDVLLDAYWEDEDWDNEYYMDMSPEDCQNGEMYDARYGMCFLACDTIEECEQLEAKLFDHEELEAEPAL